MIPGSWLEEDVEYVVAVEGVSFLGSQSPLAMQTVVRRGGLESRSPRMM